MYIQGPSMSEAMGSSELQRDRELLSRFRRGDRAALEAIYWAYLTVVERAVRLVECNRERFAKRIRAGTRARGSLILAPDGSDETVRLRRVVESWPDDGSTRAVLARTNRELLPAVAVALELGRPFRAPRIALPIESPLVDEALGRLRAARHRHPLLAIGRLRSEAITTGRRDRARVLGAHGVVAGVLTDSGVIDRTGMRALVESAAPLPVTCHRAFDRATNRDEAVDALIDAGVTRVLTSGGAPTAAAGAGEIARLVARVAGRMIVVGAGTVRPHNAAALVAATRVTEIHAHLGSTEEVAALVRAAREPGVGAETS